MKQIKIKAILFFSLVSFFVILIAQIYHLFLPLQKGWEQLVLWLIHQFTPEATLSFPNLANGGPLLSWKGILSCIALGLFLLGITIAMTSHLRRWITTLSIIFLLATTSLLLAFAGVGWNPLPYQLFALVSSLSLFLFLQTNTGWRYPQIQRLLGGKLSLKQLDRVLESSLSADFLGENRTGSIVIVSLANHQELQERMSAQDYVAMINFYLEIASDFLVDVGGYLDHYSADYIRILFDIPLPSPTGLHHGLNHGLKAAKTALDLMERISDLNRQCDTRWQERLDVRIAINSGPMIAASYGGKRNPNYSVAGGSVDFAHYLAAVGLNYGARILVGPKTYQMAQEEFEFRPIDRLRAKGSKDGERDLELYEVLSSKGMLSLQREKSRDAFCQGVIHFRHQEWDQAIKAFSTARIQGLPDLVLDLYLERVVQLRQWGDLQKNEGGELLHYGLLS